MLDFDAFVDAVHRSVLERIDVPELAFATGTGRCVWTLGDVTVVMSALTRTEAGIGATSEGVRESMDTQMDDLGVNAAADFIAQRLYRGLPE